MDCRPRRIVATGAGVVLLSGVASAHEVGGTRFDAPLPLPLVFGGAGVVVAVTAVWLGVASPSLSSGGGRPRLFVVSAPWSASIRTAGRGLFLVGFAAALAHGVLGKQAAAENLATVFAWPVWLKGVGLFAALAGSPWRVLSPWRTLYDGLTRLEGDELAVVGEYPSWLGRWPALVGFLVLFGVLENLTIVPRSPRLTVAVIAGYAVVMLVGAVAFGTDWFRHADALGVLYGLFGRVAPVDVRRTDAGGYDVRVRAPWTGCTRPVGGVALVVFVVATVYTVSFDGFTSTREYQRVLFAVREFLGVGPTAQLWLYVLGLGAFVAGFAVASALVRGLSTGSFRGWTATARGFAPTLVPIAIAYEAAHNYPFVVRNVGQLATVAGGLLGPGSGPDVALLGWLSLPAFWASQVLFIVAGHVVAVIAAHRVAVDRYSTLSAARRGHLPLVVVMVGYTVLSLWIVSRPVVSG